MHAIHQDISFASRIDARVLLTGESSILTELFARLIHKGSTRSGKTFASVRCAANIDRVTEALVFGQVRGSTADAAANFAGWLERVDGGTLHLSHIDRIGVSLQRRLLTFLEQGRVRPLGGSEGRIVDVRLIASTSASLHTLVQEGAFLEDLYYRLNVVHLVLPKVQTQRALAAVLDRRAKPTTTSVENIVLDASTGMIQFWPKSS